MAPKAKAKAKPEKKAVKIVRKVNFAFIHKLFASVSLLAFCVVTAAGVMAEARIVTIAYRACGVMLVIGIVSRIVIRILASYEEMSGDKA